MKLSHISIVVPDLERAVKTMQEIYGLACGKISENTQQGVRLTYIDFGNSMIELMQPLAADSPIGRFLTKHPAGGLHHLCLGVSDLAQMTTALRDKGLTVATGEFGAMMDVELVNDGPVTLFLER